MDAEVHTHELHGSKYWIIDDLLEEPNKLARYLFARQTASLQGAPWQDNNKTFFKDNDKFKKINNNSLQY